MKQELQTAVFGDSSTDQRPTNKYDPKFAALFVVAGSRRVDSATLKTRLRISEGDVSALLDDLQKRYLVDVVSQLEGGSVVETLRLTEHGVSTLQTMMERMCELPELA